MGSANKKYCDNDKFPLFSFLPLHSVHTCPIRSHALDKPKYGSPIFGKQHAASHYTMSRNEPLQYYRYFLTHNPKEYLYGQKILAFRPELPISGIKISKLQRYARWRVSLSISSGSSQPPPPPPPIPCLALWDVSDIFSLVAQFVPLPIAYFKKMENLLE